MSSYSGIQCTVVLHAGHHPDYVPADTQAGSDLAGVCKVTLTL